MRPEMEVLSPETGRGELKIRGMSGDFQVSNVVITALNRWTESTRL